LGIYKGHEPVRSHRRAEPPPHPRRPAPGRAAGRDLVEALALSQPGVSKHLKLLKAAGLVQARADGQRRLYRLDPRGMAELTAWLAPHRRFWAERLSALEDHLERDQ
jgi:DNA-binding transcriptional ArsR family regulator